MLCVLQDVFRLYAFALCLQIIIHILYFTKAAAFQQTPVDVVRKLLDMLMYAAPVGVPTVMMIIGNIGTVRLARENISLMFPEALKLGALADVVCFDKTGTLTHSAVSLCSPFCLPVLQEYGFDVTFIFWSLTHHTWDPVWMHGITVNKSLYQHGLLLYSVAWRSAA